jgi:hypothetical protein
LVLNGIIVVTNDLASDSNAEFDDEFVSINIGLNTEKETNRFSHNSTNSDSKDAVFCGLMGVLTSLIR